MDVVRSVVKFKGVCQRVKILKPQVELISASIRIIYPISHRKMGKLFYQCKDSLHPPSAKRPQNNNLLDFPSTFHISYKIKIFLVSLQRIYLLCLFGVIYHSQSLFHKLVLKVCKWYCLMLTVKRSQWDKIKF